MHRETYTFHLFSRNLLIIIFFLLLILASTKPGTVSTNPKYTQTPIAGERKASVARWISLPVTVSAIRNLQNEDWLKDLEIEVQNNSGKAVYGLTVKIDFPDIPETTEADGVPRGYACLMVYGRLALLNREQVATSEDVPIKPGEKHVFKIPEPQWRGLKSNLARREIPESIIKSIMIRIGSIIFSDGSGFIYDSAVPPKEGSKANPFLKDRGGTGAEIANALRKNVILRNSTSPVKSEWLHCAC